MLPLVVVVRTDVSKERITSIISVKIFGEVGMPLAVTNNRNTLRRNTRLPITANVVPSSPILVTLMMKAILRNVESHKCPNA
jgi:hypothetical protein